MRTPPRTERVPRSGVAMPARILSSVDLPAPFGPMRPAWSPSKSPNESASKSDRAPYDLLTASQLRRSERLIRDYFFFFGFFFSLRMPVPLATVLTPFEIRSQDSAKILGPNAAEFAQSGERVRDRARPALS